MTKIALTAGSPEMGAYSFTNDLPAAKLRLHSRKTMVALSHLIEEHAATTEPQTLLIAAFQRFSLFQAELARYRDFTTRLAAISVIGVPDIALPELRNLAAIPIEVNWPLAQEWVVIASGPTCCVGLFARDAEGFQLDRRSKAFHGLWTTEPELLDSRVNALHDALGMPRPRFERDTRAMLRSTQAIQHALSARLRSS
jgi:DICT domain-containing protein